MPRGWRRAAVAAAAFAVLGLGVPLGMAAQRGGAPAVAAVLADPLSLFAARSPGARPGGALAQTKARLAATGGRDRVGPGATRTAPTERVLSETRTRPGVPDLAPAGIPGLGQIGPLGDALVPAAGQSLAPGGGGPGNGFPGGGFPGIGGGFPGIGGGGGGGGIFPAVTPTPTATPTAPPTAPTPTPTATPQPTPSPTGVVPTPVPTATPVVPQPTPTTPAPSPTPVTPVPVPTSPVPGVPEPGSWAVMLIGFGLVGTALRRRRALRQAVPTGG